MQFTDAAREALGIESTENSESARPERKTPPATASAPRAGTKIAKVIALLQRKRGATLDEMIKATGWLPHTTRAAPAGLKKKGHTLERDKRDEATCYRITVSA